jgi:hypothetical protein
MKPEILPVDDNPREAELARHRRELPARRKRLRREAG